MFQSKKKFFAVLLLVIFSLAIASAAYAEASTSERSVTGFFRRLFNWGPKTVQNTGEMTANTLNNTGEKVIAKTGEETAAVLQGDIAKTPAIVTEPAVGMVQTTGQTAAETVQAPIKAAEEDTTAPAAPATK